MLKNKVYRICTACEIKHYENCESCYGFGVYKISTNPSEAFPVTAAEAHDKQFKGAVLPCPECGSTQKGCPTLRAADGAKSAPKVVKSKAVKRVQSPRR